MWITTEKLLEMEWEQKIASGEIIPPAPRHCRSDHSKKRKKVQREDRSSASEDEAVSGQKMKKRKGRKGKHTSAATIDSDGDLQSDVAY